MRRTIEEYARRARQVGHEQALAEAAEWHPMAAAVIVDFLSFAVAVTAP